MARLIKSRYIAVLALSLAAAAFDATAAGGPASSPAAAPLAAQPAAPGPAMKRKKPKMRAPSAPEDCNASWPGCACPDDLSTLRITQPPGMKLVSGNCHLMGGQISLGDFVFEGDATVTGTITYQYNEMFDRSDVYFKAAHSHLNEYTPAQYRQFAYAIDDFQVYDGALLPGPPVSYANSCQVASAVIRIRTIKIVISSQDDDGTFVTSYDLVKLGKYRKCAPRS